MVQVTPVTQDDNGPKEGVLLLIWNRAGFETQKKHRDGCSTDDRRRASAGGKSEHRRAGRRLTAWHPEMGDDKRSREETADDPIGFRAQARVKARCKRPRVAVATLRKRQAPSGATAERLGLLVLRPGSGLMSDRGDPAPRGMIVTALGSDRTPLTV